MKYSNLISGFFWLTIGLFLALWSTRYPIGGLITPSLGFFPFLLGILLIFLSLVLLMGEVKKPSFIEERICPFSPQGGLRKVTYTIYYYLYLTPYNFYIREDRLPTHPLSYDYSFDA